MSNWSGFLLQWLLAVALAGTGGSIVLGQSVGIPASSRPGDLQPSIVRGLTTQQIAADPSLANDPLNQPLDNGSAKQSSPAESPSAPRMSLTTMVGGLAVCVGAFLLFIWATRRNVPKTIGPLPPEVLEPLGRAPLSGRQQLQLIRLGKKLVLLNVTPTSAETLAEIDDPDEVVRLTGLCQQTKPNSVTATFREVLGQYAEQPESKGYFASMRQVDMQLADRASRRTRVAREEIDD